MDDQKQRRRSNGDVDAMSVLVHADSIEPAAAFADAVGEAAEAVAEIVQTIDGIPLRRGDTITFSTAPAVLFRGERLIAADPDVEGLFFFSDEDVVLKDAVVNTAGEVIGRVKTPTED